MKDGGPAFPRPVSIEEGEISDTFYGAQTGMSLRDYFAVHAPAGEVALIGKHSNISSYTARYIWADDMLKARER